MQQRVFNLIMGKCKRTQFLQEHDKGTGPVFVARSAACLFNTYTNGNEIVP